jgi:hypothetical protein
LLLIACCFFLFSCYTPRYVYSPAAHNVPVLVKKGDSKLAANYSVNMAEEAGGYDLQGAYAFTNHWALQLNYFKRTEKNSGDFSSAISDSTVIAVGYFHSLNERQLVFFQVFAGAGFGKFGFTDVGRDATGLYRSRYHNMDIAKIFIQPALMVKSRGSFAASLSSRYSVIYFKNIKTDYSVTDLENYTLDSLNASPRLFWEPAMVFTFGYKKLPGISFEFQNGFSFLMSRRFVDYRSFNFSAGLVFDLPKLFTINRHSSKN